MNIIQITSQIARQICQLFDLLSDPLPNPLFATDAFVAHVNSAVHRLAVASAERSNVNDISTASDCVALTTAARLINAMMAEHRLGNRRFFAEDLEYLIEVDDLQQLCGETFPTAQAEKIRIIKHGMLAVVLSTLRHMNFVDANAELVVSQDPNEADECNLPGQNDSAMGTTNRTHSNELNRTDLYCSECRNAFLFDEEFITVSIFCERWRPDGSIVPSAAEADQHYHRDCFPADRTFTISQACVDRIVTPNLG